MRLFKLVYCNEILLFPLSFRSQKVARHFEHFLQRIKAMGRQNKKSNFLVQYLKYLMIFHLHYVKHVEIT